MDKIFKALADRNRRLVLTLLRDQPMSVNEIVEKMTIGQATVSAHLIKLRKAGVLEVAVVGKKRIYKIDVNVWSSFIREINGFVKTADLYQSSEIIIRRKSQ